MSTTFSNFTSDTTKVFTVEEDPQGALTFTDSNNQVKATIANPAAAALPPVNPNPPVRSTEWSSLPAFQDYTPFSTTVTVPTQYSELQLINKYYYEADYSTSYTPGTNYLERDTNHVLEEKTYTINSGYQTILAGSNWSIECGVANAQTLLSFGENDELILDYGTTLIFKNIIFHATGTTKNHIFKTGSWGLGDINLYFDNCVFNTTRPYIIDGNNYSYGSSVLSFNNCSFNFNVSSNPEVFVLKTNDQSSGHGSNGNWRFKDCTFSTNRPLILLDFNTNYPTSSQPGLNNKNIIIDNVSISPQSTLQYFKHLVNQKKDDDGGHYADNPSRRLFIYNVNANFINAPINVSWTYGWFVQIYVHNSQLLPVGSEFYPLIAITQTEGGDVYKNYAGNIIYISGIDYGTTGTLLSGYQSMALAGVSGTTFANPKYMATNETTSFINTIFNPDFNLISQLYRVYTQEQ